MPLRLPRITNPKVAILLLTFYGFSSGCMNTYQVSMVSTMEKRFEWPTTQVGWLLAADDIGYLTTVVLVAYLSSANRQTLVLSTSALVTFCAACLKSSPFFIFGSKFSTGQILGLKNATVQLEGLANATGDSPVNLLPNFERQQFWAFGIEVVAGVMHGIASTPFWNVGLALIDDMAGKDSGPYLGFVFLTRTTSPIVGFMLGGFLSGVNENLELQASDFALGTKDPRWIGAWWMGILGIGCLMLVNTPLITMLDVKRLQEAGERSRTKALEITNDAANANDSSPEVEQTPQANQPDPVSKLGIRDLCRILKDLYSNPVFAALNFGTVFEFAAFIIFLTYFPKYIESNFYVTAKEASMMSSVSLASSSALAIIISGVVSKLKPMSMTQMNFYHAAVNVIAVCVFPILFLFGCDRIQLIGGHNFREELPGLNMSVNAAMKCDRVTYDPICIGNTSFMTPCFAGCEFAFQGSNITALSTVTNGSSARCASAVTHGICSPVCSSVYLYLAVFFCFRVIGSMASVQFSLIMMRLPKSPQHKSLSLGSVTCLIGLLGVAIPPITGLLIDKVCVVQNPSARGTSFCLFYDTDKFRWLMHGIGMGLQIPSCVMFSLAYWASRRRYPDGVAGSQRRRQLAGDSQDVARERETRELKPLTAVGTNA